MRCNGVVATNIKVVLPLSHSFHYTGKHKTQRKTRPWHRQTHGSQNEDMAVLVEEDDLNDLSMEQFEMVQSEPEEVQRSSEAETPEFDEVFVDVHPKAEEKIDLTHID